MIVVNFNQFRDGVKRHLDLVTEDCETLVVTREGKRNIVVISEEAYNNLIENICNYSEPLNHYVTFAGECCHQRIEYIDTMLHAGA